MRRRKVIFSADVSNVQIFRSFFSSLYPIRKDG